MPNTTIKVTVAIATMGSKHGPSIKNDEKYEALRDQGYSKSKSAAIANTPDSGKKGGHAKAYEERSKKELYEQAKDLDIKGRSSMSKSELIDALRNN